MELKDYQQEVLKDLAEYMAQLALDNNLREAYSNYWKKKGININILDNAILHPYDNTVKGVPRVMFKVPTAGGKTFIACNALKTIFDNLPAQQPRVVVWFVPSDPILAQTYENLSNPNHPYRRRINALFNNAVRVVDKETALSGQGIKPVQIAEQLTIFVLSVQSFAANNKDGRRVYRENSALMEYVDQYGSDHKIEGADQASLIQAIAHLNPVVIIDESHNFEADLRLDMLSNINPRFILDLTATPRKKSNIISFVDAMKLKKANMVKLPVILYNRDSTSDVLLDAIRMQRNLECRAKECEKNGGAYIRPIVLLQAQPKTDQDNETFDKVKQSLIACNIPEEQIKIKTAEKNEIKNIDLMSRDCPVRFIITVNALKEGWDCPFAYILASLANKTSKIDVEQILGRVLRLPYTTRHSDEFLNYSYVFTSSNNFRETVEAVILSLNNAGFSSKDCRMAEEDTVYPPTQLVQPTPLFDSDEFNLDSQFHDKKGWQSSEEIQIDTQQIREQLEQVDTAKTEQHVNDMLERAKAQNQIYERENKEDLHNPISSEMKDKIKTYTIKETFSKEASAVHLPIFKKKINKSSLFSEKDSFVKLDKVMLSEGFLLENADSNIKFSDMAQEVVRIDLEKRGEDEYVPRHFKMNRAQIHAVREMFVEMTTEAKRKNISSRIAKQLKFDEIHEPHISNYVKKVLDQQSDECLMELLDNESSTVKAFRDKIERLMLIYQKENFIKMIDVGQICCEPDYSYPKKLTLSSRVVGIPKGLYIEEGDMNNFENAVISQVANLENILYWHRNPERGQGFGINGFLNHYPDFIVQTKSGKIILIETKGDDRDNSDSENKLFLGQYWANQAGKDYRYFMVFDKARLDGAYTMAQLMEILKQL